MSDGRQTTIEVSYLLDFGRYKRTLVFFSQLDTGSFWEATPHMNWQNSHSVHMIRFPRNLPLWSNADCSCRSRSWP